jgi:hypothetical protein
MLLSLVAENRDFLPRFAGFFPGASGDTSGACKETGTGTTKEQKFRSNTGGRCNEDRIPSLALMTALLAAAMTGNVLAEDSRSMTRIRSAMNRTWMG